MNTTAPPFEGRRGLTRLVLLGVASVILLAVPQSASGQTCAVPGQWSGPYLWNVALPSPPADWHEIGHAMLLLTGPAAGQVLLWAFDGACTAQTALFYLFDPANPTNLTTLTQTPPLPSDIFCSGHMFRPDGTIVAAGGLPLPCPQSCNPTQQPPTTGAQAYTFNPAALQWTQIASMQWPRFYPTLFGVQSHPAIAPGDPVAIAGTVDFCVYTFGANNFDAGYIGGWEYLDVTGAWVTAGPNAGVLLPPASGVYFRWYPMIFALFVPTGGLEAFLVAGDTHLGAIPPPPPPPPPAPPFTQVLNKQSTTYTLLPYAPTQPLVAGPPLIPRYSGSAIIIHDSANTNRVLRFGGSDGATFTSHVALSAVEEWDPANQVWVAKAPLLQARLFQNAVILPDRTVFVVGGSSHDYHNAGPGLLLFPQPKIYDPGAGPMSMSGTSCFAASQSTPRVYHSVACLLPDGRVLACGGQDVNPTLPSKDTGAVFTPSYHLVGPRRES